MDAVRKQEMVDIPGILFGGLMHKTVKAEIVSMEKGVLAGAEELSHRAEILGLRVDNLIHSGAEIRAAQTIVTITGNPVNVVKGEDILLGAIGKFSGVATAAREATHRAGKIKVVCGGWKKMPIAIKKDLRLALEAGGAYLRILAEPFLYIDKNYLRIFGSLKRMLESARTFSDRALVIQLKGEEAAIEEEAVIAATYGARVLMVDTGRFDDLKRVTSRLKREGLRQRVQIAFANGLRLGDLENLQSEDLDIVDIGRAVIDAPMIDFRYSVIESQDHGNAAFRKNGDFR